MALDKHDIELLRQMMREEISASESRMDAKMDSKIKESETRMMTYMESHLEKKIDLLADGLQATNEHLARLESRMDEMNETVLANTMYIIKDASAKRKAQ